MDDLSTVEPLNTTALVDIPSVAYMPLIYMIIVLWLVYIPILGYFALEYYRYRNTMFMQKRKGVIMRVHLAITLSYLMFILPFFVGVADACLISGNAKGWEYWQRAGLMLYYIGTEFFVYAVFYSLIWRAMMMWWEYNEHHALKNDEWMHYLSSGSEEAQSTTGTGKLPPLRMESVVSMSSQDTQDVQDVTVATEQSPGPVSTIRSTEHSWVFRYKKTLGNQWWVFRRLACCWAVVAGTLYFFYVCAVNSGSAYWVGWWMYEKVFIVDLSLALFHMLVVLAFWFATPTFHDPFKIRNEMRYMTLALFIIPVISWIWYPLYTEVASFQIAESCIIGLQFTTMFLLLMSSIGYSVTKGKALGYLVPIRNGSQTGELDPLTGEPVPQPNVAKGATATRKIRLPNILAERKMLDLFAQHLVTEFSVECILSVIEFCQFKMKLNGDKDFMSRLQAEQEKTKQKTEEIPMPKLPFKKLPRSNIVFGPISVPTAWKTSGSDMIDEYKMRAFVLFERYVDPGTAELEINISYQERRSLMAIFDKERFWSKDGISCDQLLTVWDVSIRSMLHLMGDSYGRFVRSSQYVHVTKHFANVKDRRASLSMSLKNIKTALGGVIPLETEAGTQENPNPQQ